MTGTVEGEASAFGRPALFEMLGIASAPLPVHDGPVAGVTRGGRFLGWMLFADELRPEADDALAQLRSLGLERLILLTAIVNS